MLCRVHVTRQRAATRDNLAHYFFFPVGTNGAIGMPSSMH